MRNFKQLLKCTAFAAMGFFALTQSQDVSAQIPAGTGESNWGGTQTGVIKTGSYIVESGATGQNFAVTVWDGPNAGLGWDDIGTGSSGSIPLLGAAIQHTDVAMSHDGKCITVVYEMSGDIFVESYYFDPGIPGMVYLSGPTMASNGSGSCKRPNIDAGNNHTGAIVWQEDISGTINTYTRAVEICGASLGPIVDLSGPYTGPGTNSVQSDVSVYEVNGAEFYNYTYVDISASGMLFELIFQVEQAAAINGGSLATVNRNVGTTMNYTGGGETIQRPRIESHLGTGYSPLDASTIVFTITSGVSPWISYHTWTYNFASGIHDLTGVTPNLNSCVNEFPVICWTASGEYIAAWNYTGNCGGVNSTGTDLLSVKLDPLGVPTSTSVLTDYQWVNQLTAGNENALSLASRYAPAGDIFSGFPSSATNRVMYKYTNTGASPYFREAAPESVDVFLNAYPNPVSDILSVEVEGMTSVALYSVTGQLLCSYGAEDLAEKSVLQIQVSDFPAGVYLLKAEGDDRNYTEKIIVE